MVVVVSRRHHLQVAIMAQTSSQYFTILVLVLVNVYPILVLGLNTKRTPTLNYTVILDKQQQLMLFNNQTNTTTTSTKRLADNSRQLEKQQYHHEQDEKTRDNSKVKRRNSDHHVALSQHSTNLLEGNEQDLTSDLVASMDSPDSASHQQNANEKPNSESLGDPDHLEQLVRYQNLMVDWQNQAAQQQVAPPNSQNQNYKYNYNLTSLLMGHNQHQEATTSTSTNTENPFHQEFQVTTSLANNEADASQPMDSTSEFPPAFSGVSVATFMDEPTNEPMAASSDTSNLYELSATSYKYNRLAPMMTTTPLPPPRQFASYMANRLASSTSVPARHPQQVKAPPIDAARPTPKNSERPQARGQQTNGARATKGAIRSTVKTGHLGQGGPSMATGLVDQEPSYDEARPTDQLNDPFTFIVASDELEPVANWTPVSSKSQIQEASIIDEQPHQRYQPVQVSPRPMPGGSKPGRNPKSGPSPKSGALSNSSLELHSKNVRPGHGGAGNLLVPVRAHSEPQRTQNPGKPTGPAPGPVQSKLASKQQPTTRSPEQPAQPILVPIAASGAVLVPHYITQRPHHHHHHHHSHVHSIKPSAIPIALPLHAKISTGAYDIPDNSITATANVLNGQKLAILPSSRLSAAAATSTTTTSTGPVSQKPLHDYQHHQGPLMRNQIISNAPNYDLIGRPGSLPIGASLSGYIHSNSGPSSPPPPLALLPGQANYAANHQPAQLATSHHQQVGASQHQPTSYKSGASILSNLLSSAGQAIKHVTGGSSSTAGHHIYAPNHQLGQPMERYQPTTGNGAGLLSGLHHQVPSSSSSSSSSGDTQQAYSFLPDSEHTTTYAFHGEPYLSLASPDLSPSDMFVTQNSSPSSVYYTLNQAPTPPQQSATILRSISLPTMVPSLYGPFNAPQQQQQQQQQQTLSGNQQQTNFVPTFSYQDQPGLLSAIDYAFEVPSPPQSPSHHSASYVDLATIAEVASIASAAKQHQQQQQQQQQQSKQQQQQSNQQQQIVKSEPLAMHQFADTPSTSDKVTSVTVATPSNSHGTKSSSSFTLADLNAASAALHAITRNLKHPRHLHHYYPVHHSMHGHHHHHHDDQLDLDTSDSMVIAQAMASKAGAVRALNHIFWPIVVAMIPIVMLVALISQITMAAPAILLAVSAMVMSRLVSPALREMPMNTTLGGFGSAKEAATHSHRRKRHSPWNDRSLASMLSRTNQGNNNNHGGYPYEPERLWLNFMSAMEKFKTIDS